MQRDVLPMPDRPHEGLITYDAKDPATSFPPIEPLRPPEGAPNVLVILLDEAAEDVDHMISPEELLRVAMARQ